MPASQKGNANEKYFLWTGNGNPKTVAANWQRSYRKLFDLVGLEEAGGAAKRCHPHLFRDTFAVVGPGTEVATDGVTLEYQRAACTEGKAQQSP